MSWWVFLEGDISGGSAHFVCTTSGYNYFIIWSVWSGTGWNFFNNLLYVWLKSSAISRERKFFGLLIFWFMYKFSCLYICSRSYWLSQVEVLLHAFIAYFIIFIERVHKSILFCWRPRSSQIAYWILCMMIILARCRHICCKFRSHKVHFLAKSESNLVYHIFFLIFILFLILDRYLLYDLQMTFGHNWESRIVSTARIFDISVRNVIIIWWIFSWWWWTFSLKVGMSFRKPR
jgi:hypothetical protein